mgnify:CR=1 FL=1
MGHGAKAVKITSDVYWVGAVDWAIRDFHGYLTARGTTYNAYLVMADKVTLVDTVKKPFGPEMLDRVASVVDPGRIDYIVSNHAEMDHSGLLPETIAATQPEAVIASSMGAKTLARHFHEMPAVTAVKDGETLSLGNMDLRFVETKMLHWPDSMFSYLPDRGVLFSQDALGMHLASSDRFDDQIDDHVLEWEAAKYYANILLPFSPLVQKLLQRLGEMDLDLKYIATDHGPVWRKDQQWILNLYDQWSRQEPTRKVLVVYDTMWGSTAKMAEAIGAGLQEGGACVKLLPLSATHRSDVATELLDAGGLVVGSPTINNNMFPTVADALSYVRGLKRQNLVGTCFGSHGWSGEAVGQVAEIMQDMKVQMIGDPVKCQWVPDEAALDQCHAAGLAVAEALEPCRECAV